MICFSSYLNASPKTLSYTSLTIALIAMPHDPNPKN